jgi:hypothetical protein
MSDYPVFDAKAAFFKTVVDPTMEPFVGDPIGQTEIDAGNDALAAFFAATPAWSVVPDGPVLYEVAVDPEDANDFIVKWTIK